MKGVCSKFNISLIIIQLIIFPLLLLAEDADELYRKGQFAEAEEVYKKADMDNPRDIRYRYNRGCAAYQNSDYKGAAAAFTSVLRRAKGKDMLFNSSYNLGNTAFVNEDFASAVEYYKMAIVYNPKSDNAKYNLELALKKLEEAKNSKDKKDQKGKDGDNGKQQNNRSEQNGGREHDKDQSKEQSKSDKGKSGEQENGMKGEDKGKQDLSGELSSADPMNENQSDEHPQSAAAAMLNKKKAEALLDNIKEDRAKIMQFQIPKDKKDGVKSGRAW